MTNQAMSTQAEHISEIPHHDASSIFPIVTCVGVASALFGTAANWNKFVWGQALIVLGLAVMAVGMIGWWWELVQENKNDEITLLGTQSHIQRMMRLGFGFFIASEVMFFAAIFAYYFYTRSMFPTWPPPGYDRLPIAPAIINTILLVSSGFIYMWGEHKLVNGGSRGAVTLIMGFAVFLGLIFLGIQAYEWYELMHHGFTITDGTFGTAFYMLTGFHGFHVIVGALFLGVVTARVALGHFTNNKHFAMTAAGWYWHFVDVVWILLVLVLYVF